MNREEGLVFSQGKSLAGIQGEYHEADAKDLFKKEIVAETAFKKVQISGGNIKDDNRCEQEIAPFYDRDKAEP